MGVVRVGGWIGGEVYGEGEEYQLQVMGYTQNIIQKDRG